MEEYEKGSLNETKLDSQQKDFIDMLIREGFLLFPNDIKVKKTELYPSDTVNICVWSITTRCNLHCKTCYIADKEWIKEELSTEEVYNILDKLHSVFGVKALNITGGEPLTRRDILYILQYARPLFQSLKLDTNGTLINKQIAKRINDISPNVVQISIDGPSEIHDSIRGKGAFEKAIRGIRLLRDTGYQKILISPTVTHTNFEYLPDIMDLAVDLDVLVGTSPFLSTGRGLKNKEEYSLTTKEFLIGYKLALERLFERKAYKQLKYFMEGLSKGFPRGISTNCEKASQYIYLMPDGAMYPCCGFIFPEFLYGNIKELNSVKELLSKSIIRRLEKVNVYTKEHCKDCDVKFLCGGGCTAHSYMTSGNLYGKDPYCEGMKVILRSLFWAYEGDINPVYIKKVIDILNDEMTSIGILR